MMRPSILGLVLVACVTLASFEANTQRASTQAQLVVLDVELSGDLGGPELAPEHQARLKLASAKLRERLSRTGGYQVIDTTPAQGAIDALKSRHRYLHDCNGCDLDIARQLGADQVLVAWVNRVSALILSLNYEIHDVTSGQITARKSFSFRGDNDTSWTRAIDYMVRDLDEQSSATAAARALLQSLPEAKRTQARLSFESNERTNWNYVRTRRAGVALKDLDAHQQALIDPLLRSALSPAGSKAAQQIVQHESILAEIEGNPRRDPQLYYTAVFGEPGSRAPWAWRFEGHHLSVNATHVDGQTQVVAPLFMGSNPARVPHGPKAGLRLLAAEEDLARELIRMLPAVRRTRAMLSDKAFPDIVTRSDPKVHSLKIEGLAARDMSQPEQAQLRRLLQVYSDRMTQSAAREQVERIERAGFDKLHFGWAGSLEPGKPHYYRLHGPTVLIEYDNTQDDANHIHSVWRDLERDFGGDLLRAHYEAHRTDGHGHEH